MRDEAAVRSLLSVAVGAFIGQWLAFGGFTSPAEMHALGLRAFARHDYAEAARQWGRAVAVQPDNPTFHYLRGRALARLGHPHSAADAYQLALMLDPAPPLARLTSDALAGLAAVPATSSGPEVTVPLEWSRGVWIAQVVLNEARPGRFLVDTGASVTLVSPHLAHSLGLGATDGGSIPTELQTVAGQAHGTPAVLGSVRLGAAEARDVPAVVHDPGLGVDGILGNSFLGRFTVTLDADRRLLRLARPMPAE